MNLVAQRLWRSLQDDGAEYASFWRLGNTWRLEGMALRFRDGPWRLDYRVLLDEAWHTRQAEVRWLRGRSCGSLKLAGDTGGHWTRDEAPDEALAGCTDVDFGFSPVTNLMPVRRLGSDPGEVVHVRAAWLVFPDLEVRPVGQTYTRKTDSTVIYRSESGFSSEISVDELGFVTDYPDLWTRA